jgi:hypothetical protein
LPPGEYIGGQLWPSRSSAVCVCAENAVPDYRYAVGRDSQREAG